MILAVLIFWIGKSPIYTTLIPLLKRPRLILAIMQTTYQSILLAALIGRTAAGLGPTPTLHNAPAPSSGCATTIIVTENSQKPPATWEPIWTITRYSETVTTQVGIDCDGCSNIHTDTLFIDYAYPAGPSSPSVSIVTASEPATETRYSCAASSAVSSGGDSSKFQLDNKVEKRSSGWKSNWKNEKSVFKRDVSDDQPKGFKKGEACTKIMHAVPKLNLGPTATQFTATITSTQTVDCGPCTKVEENILPIGVPPVAEYQTTVTPEQPYVHTAFVCAPSAAANRKWDTQQQPTQAGEPHYYQPPPVEVHTVTPDSVVNPHCTTQAVVEPEVPNETTTIYGLTKTHTSTLDCGGCQLEWSTAVLQFFAPIRITATVTASRASTQTVLTCAKATGKSG